MNEPHTYPNRFRYLAEVLWVIEYHEWWNFDIDLDNRQQPAFEITVWTHDSRSEDERIGPLVFTFPLKGIEFTSFENAAQYVRERIHQALAHEADEHILINGERYFDPHEDEFTWD